MGTSTAELTPEQVQDYHRMRYARDCGGGLDEDGLRFLCRLYHYAPSDIGSHILSMLPEIRKKADYVPAFIDTSAKLSYYQAKEYAKMCEDRAAGRYISPDDMCEACAELEFEPETIGWWILELNARAESEERIMAELYLPTISHFIHKNIWSGSRGQADYWLAPSGDSIKAEVWQGPWCKDATEHIDFTREFSLSEEGIEEMREWLLEKIEDINARPMPTPAEMMAQWKAIRERQKAAQ